MQTTTTLSGGTDLRSRLQHEFLSRCRKNRAYSLRSFARHLQIDQSLLTKILRSQRSISTALAQRLELKLGLEDALRSQNFRMLADDEVQLVGNWIHFALLELAKTKQFSPDPTVIARRLGVHPEEVRAAVARLERFGFISIDKDGEWQLLSPSNTWSHNSETTEARRLLQKQLLEKSLEALENIPFCDRDHGSLTIAIKKSDLPRLKKRLDEIRMEFGRQAQENSDLDEVYQVTTSLFPLTKSPRRTT